MTPIGDDLATRNILMATTGIVVLCLQMTHKVLVILDTNKLSLSLVCYLERDNAFESYVDSNGF